MHGPVDHLHPALAELGARYVANTVAVRPGFPMLLAEVPAPARRPAFVAGLPGNPQSAIVALVSLVVPLLHGLTGRPAPRPGRGDAWPSAVPGRGDFTHLALVRLDDDGLARAAPARRVGDAARAGPGRRVRRRSRPEPTAQAGDRVPFVPLPLTAGRPIHGDVLTAPDHRAARRRRARGGGGPPGRGRGGLVRRRRPRPRRRPRRYARLDYEAHPSADAVLAEVAAEIAKDPRGVRGRGLAPGRRPRASATSRWPPRSPPRTGPTRSRLCARLVDEVKARLPVWKHQLFADGTDEWVNSP